MEARAGSRGRYHRQGEDHGAENLTKAQVYIYIYIYIYLNIDIDIGSLIIIIKDFL